jgi:hypothetical protein
MTSETFTQLELKMVWSKIQPTSILGKIRKYYIKLKNFCQQIFLGDLSNKRKENVPELDGVFVYSGMRGQGDVYDSEVTSRSAAGGEGGIVERLL